MKSNKGKSKSFPYVPPLRFLVCFGTWVHCLRALQTLLIYIPVGLARTINIRCIYGIFGREITKDTVIYGAYILLWPTLHFHKHHARSQSTKHTCSYLTMLVAIALSEYSGRYLLFSKRTHTSTAHEDHFLTRGSMFATAKTVELYLS